ncbi:MAG: tRNA uracil 4-sulfurtransferase ThiI [Candidatus Magasanikbacteria bacterium]
MNVIIHVDEIFLKGGNQPFFYRALIKNLSTVFSGAIAKRIEGAIWLENFRNEDFDKLQNIPGIANYAPAFWCQCELEEIKSAVDKIEEIKSAKLFRVTTVRSHKAQKLSSAEIDKNIGQYIAQKYNLKVNLTKHNFEAHIDVGKNGTAVYGNLFEGAGGLPSGSMGKVMCLLSGGIDSPVAAYEMMKRGTEVEFIHFQNQTQVSEQVGEKIFDLVKTLAFFQGKSHLLIVPYGEIQRQIIMKVPADYRMIISRRIFFRLAEKFAREGKISALITGDSLGQVASQTLENLSVIYEATDILKLSPLIGSNKREITKLARRIGTLPISNRPYEDCCSLFVAKHPETKAKLVMVKKIEQGIDFGILDKIAPISYYIGSN